MLTNGTKWSCPLAWTSSEGGTDYLLGGPCLKLTNCPLRLQHRAPNTSGNTWLPANFHTGIPIVPMAVTETRLEGGPLVCSWPQTSSLHKLSRSAGNLVGRSLLLSIYTSGNGDLRRVLRVLARSHHHSNCHPCPSVTCRHPGSELRDSLGAPGNAKFPP